MSEIEIVDFSPKKGWGVGRDEKGRDVEVAHALIGDLIEADVKKSKRKGVHKARLLHIVKSSPHRTEARCEHARICGGCTFQELVYSKQLEYKQQIVQKAFHAHLGKFVEILPTTPSPKIFAYRNKMEFTFSENRAGEKFLGLMIAGTSRYVFNVQQCHLMDEWTAAVLGVVREWWNEKGYKAYIPHKNEGELRNLTLRQSETTHEKMVLLTVTGGSSLCYESFQEKIVSLLGKNNLSISIKEHYAKKGMRSFDKHLQLFGKDHITETLLINGRKLTFRISPSSFFQPNTLQAQAFYQRAFSLMGLSKKSSVIYDLYSGTGTLAMIASSYAKKVIAIEQNPQSVADAIENAKINQVDNLEIHQGDVEKVLPTIVDRPEAVIVDPPRAGLSEKALDVIGSLLPSKILYISCNPQTQAQNIAVLAAYGYNPIVVQPFDQFPHTPHVENITLLSREK